MRAESAASSDPFKSRALKEDERTADKCAMGFVHACLFCGWSRDATTATIVEPQCESCGCVLVSSRERPAEPAMPALRGGPSVPPALTWLAKGLAVAAVMAAGTVVGYDSGGPWLAGVGFSATGLFAVPPLVPQSY